MKKIFTIFAALACMMSMSAATWTVAGAPKAVFGSEWDPANTANVMADQGDGNYKWEKSDLTLAASTIEFKVVKGNAWGEEYPGANYRLKINESGVYTITITFNEGTHEVNAVATKQGAAEVIPTIAIAGDMNGWNTTANEFVIADDKKTASLTLALEAKDYGFKMIVAGGWTSDGATITRENNTTVFTGANSDNNCTLTADVAGDYTFTWVYKTNTLTVTYPEAGENPGEEPGDDPVVDPETGVTYNVTVPAGTKACYIAGEMNGWSQQEMTKVDETHYTITIADATTAMKYKYCSGPSWDYVEMQADGATDVQDRTYAANDVVEAWKAVYDPAGEEPGDDPVVDPETGITYNVTVPAGTKACYIAGEMNEWKHQEMTKVDETHYTITIATATATMKYKYCSGPDWAYVEMQADGVTDVQDRTYAANDVVDAWKAVYEPAGEEPGDDPVITPDLETGVTYNVTVPAGTKACYIAGEMNGWSQQEMTKVDETHYTITIAEATTAMKYKYCSGPSWDYVEMQADGVTDVQDRTYAANDVVDAWKAVYEPAGEEPGDDPVITPDPETGVTYNVTVPAGTKACYIAGEMNSWSFTEMTKIDDTHYTVTLAEATDTMGYKYCSGPGWAYVELTEEGGEVANRTYAANDVVEAWKTVYDPANAPTPGEAKDITIKAKVPATWTETITAWVWATGEPGKAVIPTKDGEWYVYTEHCPELNIIFRNGSEWSTVDNKTVDMTFTESTCIQLAQEGGDMATYTVVDCEGGEVIEPAQITYVLMGVGGDWTTGIYLTRNVTALEEEYVLLNQPIAEGDSVKVVTLTDGIPTAWCGDVDEASTVSYTNDEVYGNIVLIPGIYDFYYKVASNMIYIATSITTAVDNITIEKNAIKVIQDGRMYILRDGVMYNVVGQIAE